MSVFITIVKSWVCIYFFGFTVKKLMSAILKAFTH